MITSIRTHDILCGGGAREGTGDRGTILHCIRARNLLPIVRVDEKALLLPRSAASHAALSGAARPRELTFAAFLRVRCKCAV